MPKPTIVEIGIKGNQVVINMYGTDEIQPSFIIWTPAEAREVAMKLLESATNAEKVS